MAKNSITGLNITSWRLHAAITSRDRVAVHMTVHWISPVHCTAMYTDSFRTDAIESITSITSVIHPSIKYTVTLHCITALSTAVTFLQGITYSLQRVHRHTMSAFAPMASVGTLTCNACFPSPSHLATLTDTAVFALGHAGQCILALRRLLIFSMHSSIEYHCGV